MCLTVFAPPLSRSSLVPLGLKSSTLYSIHFFTQLLSSLGNTCPYHRNLFCCSTQIMSYIPSLSLRSLPLPAVLPPHFSYGSGLISVQHTTSHTTAVLSIWCRHVSVCVYTPTPVLVKTATHRIMQTMPHDSPGTLVFRSSLERWPNKPSKNVRPYVHNETQCSHKPNKWHLLRLMRHSRRYDFQGHPRSGSRITWDLKFQRWQFSNSISSAIFQPIKKIPMVSDTHNRFTVLLEYVRDHPGEQVPER